MQELLDRVRLAVAVRMARGAIGWSQQEMADQCGMAKTTLARFEVAEGGLSSEQLTRIFRLLHSLGVTIDVISSDSVNVSVSTAGLQGALDRLQDEELRRADRRKPTGLLYSDPVDSNQLSDGKKSNKNNGLLNSIVKKDGP